MLTLPINCYTFFNYNALNIDHKCLNVNMQVLIVVTVIYSINVNIPLKTSIIALYSVWIQDI